MRAWLQRHRLLKQSSTPSLKFDQREPVVLSNSRSAISTCLVSWSASHLEFFSSWSDRGYQQRERLHEEIHCYTVHVKFARPWLRSLLGIDVVFRKQNTSWGTDAVCDGAQLWSSLRTSRGAKLWRSISSNFLFKQRCSPEWFLKIMSCNRSWAGHRACLENIVWHQGPTLSFSALVFVHRIVELYKLKRES